VVLLVLAASILCGQTTAARQIRLPPAEVVAEGVELFRIADPDLVSPPAKTEVRALRLDPRRVRLTTALAPGPRPSKAPVARIAAAHRALAAVNAGFFVMSTGAPAGVLKVDGRLVGEARLARGAVAISRPKRGQPVKLLFDQVSVERIAGKERAASYTPRLGTRPKDWQEARWIVGGAGLLIRDGKRLRLPDWAGEQLNDGFVANKHPRTLIGVDASGAIWLVVVDGRNPFVSIGMTLAELQDLAEGLGLREALNLDGGGSTTMVVRGEVVNHPSDTSGPRSVSDALLIFKR
jgi:exopolysaccharide biosynthesis protein